MDAVELYIHVFNFLTDLWNTYGDNIDCIEVYDGNLVVHFKKEEIASRLLADIVDKISKLLWGK